jgi:uncharacterized membrane-anchored protein
MKRYKWPLVLLNLALVIILFNWSVIQKEKTLKGGRLVLLELAPVDPRSLMQGDYMVLNYAIARREVTKKEGYFVVVLDQYGVAKLTRIQPGQKPLHPGEMLIRYKAPDYWNVHIGAESYFFEEGKSERFAKAKFGGLRVSPDGNSILTGLYDEQHRLINP